MGQKRGYQLDYLREHDILRNMEGRTQKFKKILSVIKDFCPQTESLISLDIGCSSGIMTSHLAKHFSMSVGIDIDQDAIRFAKAEAPSPHVHFLVADSMALPFRDNALDVAICNHIYEHVPEAGQMMEEIYRTIKKQGFCYFSAGNKYMVTEGHYKLPFLSWLPKTLAHTYLRLSGRGDFYYERHLSLRNLKRLAGKFEIHDYTVAIIRDPAKFSATDILNTQSRLYGWIRKLAPYLYSWIPTYVWVLTKN